MITHIYITGQVDGIGAWESERTAIEFATPIRTYFNNNDKSIRERFELIDRSNEVWVIGTRHKHNEMVMTDHEYAMHIGTRVRYFDPYGKLHTAREAGYYAG
jgi:hypothetical protein